MIDSDSDFLHAPTRPDDPARPKPARRPTPSNPDLRAGSVFAGPGPSPSKPLDQLRTGEMSAQAPNSAGGLGATAPSNRIILPGESLVLDAGFEIRDASQQQLSQLHTLLTTDFYFFCLMIMDYQDLYEPLHRPICELVQRWGQPGYRRIMLQIPRDCFKTSIVSRANSLWQQCREPDEPIAIFNEKLDNSKKWLRAIKEIVTGNRIFQYVFRDLLPPGMFDGQSLPKNWKWSDEEICFQRGKLGIPEASITAVGIGAAATSHHWPKIIKDDLISFEASKSPTVMQYAKDWFDSSLYFEKPAMGGMDFIACTPWSYDDLYRYILDTYNEGDVAYKLYRRSALENFIGQPDLNGESIFPTKLNKRELLIRASKNPVDFSAQMQCQPRPGKELAFDPSCLRWGKVQLDRDNKPYFTIEKNYYDPNINPAMDEKFEPPQAVYLDNMDVAVILDPAPSEASERRQEASARNGIIVVGMDPWGRRFALEAFGILADPYDVILKVFETMERWSTTKLGIEEVNFSKLYRKWIEQELKSGKHLEFSNGYINIKKLLTGGKRKDTRISGLIPAYRRGEWYLARDGCNELFVELTEYPHSRTRDILDAQAYTDMVLSRPESPSEHDRRMQHYSGRFRPRGNQTCYGY
jgi:hypothetical protein